MNAQLRSDFQRFLESGGYCTPPGRAACALSSARVLEEWRQMEAAARKVGKYRGFTASQLSEFAAHAEQQAKGGAR